jgi:hypothetical protein
MPVLTSCLACGGGGMTLHQLKIFESVVVPGA